MVKESTGAVLVAVVAVGVVPLVAGFSSVVVVVGFSLVSAMICSYKGGGAGGAGAAAAAGVMEMGDGRLATCVVLWVCMLSML